MPEITSADNPRLQHLKKLGERSSYRREQQEAVIEGPHLLLAAVHRGLKPKQLWLTRTAAALPELASVLAEIPESQQYLVADALFEKISGVVNGPGVLGLVSIPQAPPDTRETSAVVLDRIQDAGNAGTILRTAAAAGVKRIIALPGTVDLWSPKVLRAAMGAHFALEISERQKWTAQTVKLPVYATSSHTGKTLYDLELSSPHIWVFGNEGQGVAEEILQNCQSVTIPQPGGEESLNVASAAAICLYEAVRQKITRQ